MYINTLAFTPSQTNSNYSYFIEWDKAEKLRKIFIFIVYIRGKISYKYWVGGRVNDRISRDK